MQESGARRRLGLTIPLLPELLKTLCRSPIFLVIGRKVIDILFGFESFFDIPLQPFFDISISRIANYQFFAYLNSLVADPSFMRFDYPL